MVEELKLPELLELWMKGESEEVADDDYQSKTQAIVAT